MAGDNENRRSLDRSQSSLITSPDRPWQQHPVLLPPPLPGTMAFGSSSEDASDLPKSPFPPPVPSGAYTTIHEDTELTWLPNHPTPIGCWTAPNFFGSGSNRRKGKQPAHFRRHTDLAGSSYREGEDDVPQSPTPSRPRHSTMSAAVPSFDPYADSAPAESKAQSPQSSPHLPSATISMPTSDAVGDPLPPIDALSISDHPSPLAMPQSSGMHHQSDPPNTSQLGQGMSTLPSLHEHQFSLTAIGPFHPPLLSSQHIPRGTATAGPQTQSSSNYNHGASTVDRRGFHGAPGDSPLQQGSDQRSFHQDVMPLPSSSGYPSQMADDMRNNGGSNAMAPPPTVYLSYQLSRSYEPGPFNAMASFPLAYGPHVAARSPGNDDSSNQMASMYTGSGRAWRRDGSTQGSSNQFAPVAAYADPSRQSQGNSNGFSTRAPRSGSYRGPVQNWQGNNRVDADMASSATSGAQNWQSGHGSSPNLRQTPAHPAQDWQYSGVPGTAADNRFAPGQNPPEFATAGPMQQNPVNHHNTPVASNHFRSPHPITSSPLPSSNSQNFPSRNSWQQSPSYPPPSLTSGTPASFYTALSSPHSALNAGANAPAIVVSTPTNEQSPLPMMNGPPSAAMLTDEQFIPFTAVGREAAPKQWGVARITNVR